MYPHDQSDQSCKCLLFIGLSERRGLTKVSNNTASPFETHPNKTVSHCPAELFDSGRDEEQERGSRRPLGTDSVMAGRPLANLICDVKGQSGKGCDNSLERSNKLGRVALPLINT